MTKAASASKQKDTLAGEFLRYLAVERNASPRTLKAYRQALEAFRAKNTTPWKKCTADDFRDYLFALMKRAQARSYVRLQFSALRSFYRFLTERKKLRRDPVRELQLPKIGKKLPLVLTKQQIEELLAAPLKIAKNRAAPVWMPLRDVAIMELFYSIGLRLSELTDLDVADVDLSFTRFHRREFADAFSLQCAWRHALFLADEFDSNSRLLRYRSRRGFASLHSDHVSAFALVGRFG